MTELNQKVVNAFLANEAYKDDGFQNIGDWQYIDNTNNHNLSNNGLFTVAYKNINAEIPAVIAIKCKTRHDNLICLNYNNNTNNLRITI